MEKELRDEIKRNTNEIKHLIKEVDSLIEKQEKNTDCHGDIKRRIGHCKIDIAELKGDIKPLKKIVWGVLLAMLASMGSTIWLIVANYLEK